MTELLDPSDLAANTFFKPADYLSATALLVEPTHFAENVRNEYNGTVRYRDEVTATITVFNSPAELASKKPSAVLEGVVLTHAALVSTGRKAVGGCFASRLEPYTTKHGTQGFRFGDLNDASKRLCAEFFESREVEIRAAADQAPPF
jgi:hypothetical protein